MFAVVVGNTLRRAGIRGTLTGGACASLYTRGAYHSMDVDFVLSDPPAIRVLDQVMAAEGFTRERDHYVQRLIPYFVEFPAGPLGIGQDFAIGPVWRARGSAKTLALSATDACRDRLAAFYHWGDRQGLATAVAIAVQNRVHQPTIRAWSRAEGSPQGYAQFISELERARAERRRKAQRKPTSRP